MTAVISSSGGLAKKHGGTAERQRGGYMNIYEKLSEIQNELKAPKSQHNDFGDYYYRSCEDILEAVKPLCKKHKAVLVITDEIKNIDNRFYITAIAELIDLEKTTDRIAVTAHAREEESKKGMDGSQVTGASSSYARKYALNGLFNIDDTKDSDTTNTGEKPKAEPKADEPLMTETQRNAFKDLNIDPAKVAIYYKTTVEKLTEKQAQDAINKKQKSLEKAAKNA
jgi:hypothetical protein